MLDAISGGCGRRGHAQALVSHRQPQVRVLWVAADDGQAIGRGCAKPVQVRMALRSASDGTYSMAAQHFCASTALSTADPVCRTGATTQQPLARGARLRVEGDRGAFGLVGVLA